MPTTTTRGLVVPKLTGDGSDLHEMFQDLADSIEAAFDSPLELGDTLTVPDIVVSGGTGQIAFRDANSANVIVLPAKVSGDAFDRLQILADGTIKRGNGTAAPTVVDGPATRGKSIIATSELRTNTAYGKLTTPDEVTVVLPTDGVIKVLFQAEWATSDASVAHAAIFLNAVQANIAGNNAPAAQEAVRAGTTVEIPLSSYASGLVSGSGGTGYSADVTTGQIVGTANGAGMCSIFAAAGTYTVSIQFKVSSGSVTVQNRRLWVAAEAY